MVYLTQGSDNTLAATLGIALGGGLGLLVLGALAAYVSSTRASDRQYMSVQGEQDALLAPLLGDKGAGAGVVLGKHITTSPVFSGVRGGGCWKGGGALGGGILFVMGMVCVCVE